MNDPRARDSRIEVGTDFLSLDTPLDEVLHRPAARLVTRILTPLPIHPNQVTVASLVPATAAALCFSRGVPGWMAAGLAAFWAWTVADHADGELARAKRLTSDFGKKLDDACDAVASGVMMAGLFWGLLRSGELDRPLVWSAVFAAAVILNEIGHNLAVAQKRLLRQTLVSRGTADARTVRNQKWMDYFSGRAPFYVLIVLALAASLFAPAGPRTMIQVMVAGTYVFAAYGFVSWICIRRQLVRERA